MPIIEAGGTMAGGPTSVLRATTEQRASSRDSGSTIFSRNAPSSVQTSHSTDLMRGLNALRRAEKLFDVSLIVEGKTFKAHRVVLAACSDYFCAMFTDAMREARQTEIKLNGVNARGIELLIEYAYTSKLELDRSNVQDVLSVSTHVQMNSVIEACSNYLESQIDLENCVAIATLADLYALDTLKRKTYRYMCSRLAEFAQTPDLHNLSWEQVEHILSCNYPVDCTEANVLKIIFKYCLHSKLSVEKVRSLMAKVRFNDIEALKLDGILDKIAAAERETNADADEELKVYNNLARQECMKQSIERAKFLANSLSSDQRLAAIDDAIAVEVLTNSRGMELALVKIGGFETNGLTNQISCFLPSKGKWENLTVIPHIDQCNYGTAVLGNDLYVVGGSYDVCLKEYTHPFGFRYCPTKDKWNSIAPIQADRCRFSLSAMGTNYLYAVGGVCELNDNDDVNGGVGGVGGLAGRIDGQVGAGEQWAYDLPVSNFERYDAKADRWEYLPTLIENRSQHAGLVIGDNLYISGGIDRHMVLATLWRFSTSTFKWQKLSPMPTPRADHTLIALDGFIFACGGWYEDLTTETRVLAETIDVYDVANNVWHTETINPMPKFYTGVAALKRKIYFIGGLLSSTTFNRATSAVQCYDLDTKEWSFNSEWEYPNEVWECSCAAFYVPTERNDMLYFCADDAARN